MFDFVDNRIDLRLLLRGDVQILVDLREHYVQVVQLVEKRFSSRPDSQLVIKFRND